MFLGYSHQFKRYRCLHPPTGKVYLSRHVVFDENMLRFLKPGSLFSSINDTGELTTFDEWVSGQSMLSDPMHLTSVISNPNIKIGTVLLQSSIMIIVPPFNNKQGSMLHHLNPLSIRLVGPNNRTASLLPLSNNTSHNLLHRPDYPTNFLFFFVQFC